LLENRTLVAQLCSLERRTARGGRDSIDHPPGGHDDLANAAMGALLLTGGKPEFDTSYRWANGPIVESYNPMIVPRSWT
jgi:hypothetical protein